MLARYAVRIGMKLEHTVCACILHYGVLSVSQAVNCKQRSVAA